jgi:hypothetical protein
MTTTAPVDPRTAERLVREQFAIIETGQLELAERNVTGDFVNHRSSDVCPPDDPLDRPRGPLRAAIRDRGRVE